VSLELARAADPAPRAVITRAAPRLAARPFAAAPAPAARAPIPAPPPTVTAPPTAPATGRGLLPQWIAGPTALGNPLTWAAPAAYLLVPGTPDWVRLLVLGLGLLSVAPGVIRRSVDPAAPTFELTWLTWKWMVALVLLTALLSGIGKGSFAAADVPRAPAFQAPAAPASAADVQPAPAVQPPAGVAPAAPAPAPPVPVYDLDEVDVVPELVNPAAFARALSAGYPARLRDAGVVGRVTVGFTIDTLGTTGSGPKWVSRTTDVAFVTPALDAVRVMRFRPAQKDGRKVPVRVELPITFALQSPP
jgi:TonB family protein